MGEVFNEWNKVKKEKKRSNKEYSTELLKNKGVKYESRNAGVHLIIHTEDGLIDFWPSTGKFITRKGVSGRGVKNLLKLCN